MNAGMKTWMGLSFLLWLSGCGASGFEPLAGKVIYQGKQDFAFAADVLELRLQSDPTARAFAEIQADGTFQVESLSDGEITRGVQPGVYDARIVIADDDAQHKQQAIKSINKKYLSFETSGLKVEVPSPHVTLEISN